MFSHFLIASCNKERVDKTQVHHNENIHHQKHFVSLTVNYRSMQFVKMFLHSVDVLLNSKAPLSS